MKLAVKLTFVVLAVVMLLAAGGSYLGVRRAYERSEGRRQQMAQDAAGAMDEWLAEAWRQVRGKGVSAAVDETPSEVMVSAARSQMPQVLANLLVDAVQFTCLGSDAA